MKTPRQHLLAMVEQFVRYVGFGSGATLVHYATLFGLVHANVPVWRASVISNAIGAGLYYVISRRAVFQTARG
ncbi:GtrA family protein, partial [Acinetobacter baumannii]